MANDELPFGHTAQDPTADSTDRARARVRRAMQARRRRRRLLVGVPVLLAAVGLAVAAVGRVATNSRDRESVYAGTTSKIVDDKLDVDPDTPWFEATLAEDGLTLTLSVGSSPPGDGPCEQTFTHDVVETADSVTIAFEEQASSTTTTGLVVCESMLSPQTFTIVLRERLGGRAVYDGVQAEPRTIHRSVELVSATWLPDGWVRQASYPETLEDGGHYWQQDFGTDGADWYVYISQATVGWFKAPPEGGEGVDVTVNGIAAKRYNWFNGTAQTIHWVQDGLDISVTGEMQGPPTFTHDGDLLRIAEGIRMPNPGRGGGSSTDLPTNQGGSSEPLEGPVTFALAPGRLQVAAGGLSRVELVLTNESDAPQYPAWCTPAGFTTWRLEALDGPSDGAVSFGGGEECGTTLPPGGSVEATLTVWAVDEAKQPLPNGAYRLVVERQEGTVTIPVQLVDHPCGPIPDGFQDAYVGWPAADLDPDDGPEVRVIDDGRFGPDPGLDGDLDCDRVNVGLRQGEIWAVTLG